jgi:hypothetical protein
LSVFLGSMLGVGMALLAELIDRRVRSPMDVAEILELPVLGVLVDRREHGWFRALFLNITKHKPSPERTEQGA